MKFDGSVVHKKRGFQIMMCACTRGCMCAGVCLYAYTNFMCVVSKGKKTTEMLSVFMC